MPLTTPNFSATQAAGTPESISVTDTSVGSDVGLTSRRVYLEQSDGTYLVPSGTTTDYVLWDISDASIDIDDILTQDTALSIRVDWMTGSVVTYTKTIAYGFQAFGENFYYGLILGQVPITVPAIAQSTNYWD